MFIHRRSRRLCLVAAAIIGLAACGSSSELTSSGAGTTTSSPATPQPAVIHIAVGAASARGQAVGEATADFAVSPESSKMSMAAAFSYVYGGDLVDLTAPAASWFFTPGAQASADSVLQVARAFGVEGDVREASADMGGGWIVGSDDYTEPSVTVGSDATLGWWYNPGAMDQAVSPTCDVTDPATPTSASGDIAADQPAPEPAQGGGSDGDPLTTVVVESSCAQPAPPTNVPSAAESEARTTELLTALGLQAADYEFETYADQWGASVTAFLLLDGIRTAMSINVGYGAEGAITWAGGFLATPQRGADYPRIGIEASVERLNDQNMGWMYGGFGTARAEENTGVASVDVAPDPANDKSDPIMPPETITPPEFETFTVTLTNARPSLEMLWDADNTVWLLPGYAFDSADNGRFSVIAVEDQYIDIADTPVDTPVELPVPEPAPAVITAP